MASNKKRKRTAPQRELTRKKTCLAPNSIKGGLPTPVTKHGVLGQCFPEVLTLRDFILQKLPESSRIRRRKISSVGREIHADNEVNEVERSVGALLDSTLIGVAPSLEPVSDNRWEQWTTFAQRGDESYVSLSNGLEGSIFSQSEVCLKHICLPNWLLTLHGRSLTLSYGYYSLDPRPREVGLNTSYVMDSAGTLALGSIRLLVVTVYARFLVYTPYITIPRLRN
jgi:hypothetical protein